MTSGEIVTLLGTASVFVIGILGWITASRTLKASKKKDAHDADQQLFERLERGAKWANEWAEGLEKKVDGLRDEVEGLRSELAQVKGWLGRLVAYIRFVQAAWARANPGTPHPKIWPDIEHLIHDHEHGKGEG